MNDYNDLMNEYEIIKKEISEESNNMSNMILRIKIFQAGLELFSNNILMFSDKKSKFFEGIDLNTINFTNNLIKTKNYIENEISGHLNNLIESTSDVSLKNLDIFNNIKESLIQERQKLNKTKEDYFNFITQKSNQSLINEDENLLFNAKKENYYQLYKYEVNQMNVIIEENNTVYENMYNELYNWKKIQKDKIILYYKKFYNVIEKIGNLFIDYSKDLSKALNEVNDIKNEIRSSSDDNHIKKPRFKKVEVEDIDKINENKELNKIEETKKEDNKIKEQNNNILYDKPLGAKSKNKVVNNDFLDFDIINKEEIDLNLKEIEKIKSSDLKDKKKKTKNPKNKSIIEKIKGLKKNEKDNKDIEIKKPIYSSGYDEFELVGKNTINDENTSEEKREELIDNIINKIISKDELISQDISQLMNLLKEDNPSTKKLYSYTFLTKLSKMNKKYVINLINRKNFMHLSNILNDITINDNNINILKLIIEISQIITYKDLYLFNILRKKNQYLSTKTFWSKLIMDFFINDLNNQANLILKTNKNNKDNSKKEKSKDKESNIYLLEYIKFSNKITKYKKLNPEQKIKLDKYARNNIINVLTKVIEGMCSFYVKKNIILDVINDFGKNFGFNEEDNNYYKLLSEAYLNRNYIYNLKKLSLNEKEEEKISKICIISNSAKFLPKNNLINLLYLEKSMTEQIKKNIFKNFLSAKIPIDERTRIWGLMLNISEIQKEYNYSQILNNLLKSLEAGEIKKESDFSRNIEMIELDVNRTSVKDKSEIKKHQKKLRNILMCLVHLFKEIGYFQGMNYIAGFLYQILDFNEEKTFYYMLAMQKNTKFKNIFQNELALLQRFFEVFKKILIIYIPEIYQHLMNNEVNENYYMPPWFLTLFMFTQTVFDKEDAPKFIFLVIENYYLNGWSAIFNAGYTIIKYHKNEIIGLKGNKLLNYMVNNFGKEDAKNNNFENIKKEYIKNSFHINEELIDKLLKVSKYEENKNKNIEN